MSRLREALELRVCSHTIHGTMENSKATMLPTVSKFRSLIESLQMIQDPIAVFRRHTARLGDTFLFHFGGIKSAIVTSNPAMIRHILKTNHENYRKSEIQMKRMRHFLGNGLLTSHGEAWRSQRRLIQQGFHRNQLADLMAIMQNSLDESIAAFEENIRQGPIDIYPELKRITFQMVAASLFGSRMRDEDVDFISRAISTVQDFIVRQIVYPYLDYWFIVSGELRKHDKMRERGDHIVLEHIRHRRNQASGHHDLLQILLDARYADGNGMSDKAVLSETMQLLVAGHETSSTALSWTLYLLARHPEHARRVKDEFVRQAGSAPIQYNEHSGLEFTVQVIEESLRLYPPFWMVDRVALTDDCIGDLKIPAGSTVIAFIYGAHHSVKLWRDPEVFNPERFSRDKRKTHTDFAYLPFGGGPRSCIGGNYAMMQMIMILRAILTKYDIGLVCGNSVVPQSGIILKPTDGIYMTFTTATNPLSPN